MTPMAQELPTGHAKHPEADARLVELEYVPASHGSAALDPGRQYEPAAHASHAVAAVLPCIVPPSHNAQPDRPASAANEPAEHCASGAAPPAHE